MSFDGTEMILLLGARLEGKRGAGGKDGGAEAGASGLSKDLTVYYIVPYLPLEGELHRAYPRLYLNSATDKVVDFCVGPLALETHTRTAFVLTRHAVRVFSMHTGREIITNTVPFVWEMTSFAPTMISVCASHRVMTLATPDDARVAVYLLQHAEDGSTHKTQEQEQKDQALRQRLSAQIRKVAAGLRANKPAVHVTTHSEHAVRTVLNVIVESTAQHQQAVVEVQDIVDALLGHVMASIDLVLARERKAGYIKEIYGSNMGFIAPTVWPPPVTEFPALRLSEPEPVVSTTDGEESDALSPNSISRQRHRAKKGKRKHHKHKLLVGDAALESIAMDSSVDTARSNVTNTVN
jgi:hypothetical protein